MSTLTNEQKQLIFDYCVGLTSDQETAQVEKLIQSNKKAAEIYDRIKAAFSPLASIEPDPCPDELVDRTIERVNALARSSRLRLRRLLEAEQQKTASTGRFFFPNFGRVLAAAAVILVAIGIWFAPLDFARQKYWQQRCQMQMSSVFQGLAGYVADHDGALPSVGAAAGSPWWWVGYQGPQDHSNTRNLWLIVKEGYVDASDCICPGTSKNRQIARKVRLELTSPRQYNDFPTRNHVTYSFRIRCAKFDSAKMQGRKILVADLNPLFENLPDDFSGSLRIRLNDRLFRLNSINHNRRGQNALFRDGSVTFLKTRTTGISQDDIFTLQEMQPGCEVRGCEWPSCETDAFLAP